MSIVRAGIYSGFATAARLLAGLVVIKLVAWFAGPTGIGKLGQFMSLMSLLSVLAGGGIMSGVTKYVAEYREDATLLNRLISSSLSYAGCASLVIGVATLLFSEQIAISLLGDAAYESLIWVLAIAQAMIALNNYIVALINGFMDVKRVALIYVAGAVLNMSITALLAWQFKLYGALLALVVGQASVLLVSLVVLKMSPYFSRAVFALSFDRDMFRRLAGYSTMTLTSALLPPLVNIWVRNHLADRFSWDQVGLWQAVSKVSEAYLLFITMAISMYYLPKLSSIRNRDELRAELRSAYAHIMPAVVVIAGTIYFLRDWVTLLLFSGDFSAAAPLYLPQLIGDVVKIAAYVLSYIMLAKAMTRAFLFSEFLFSATYIALVYLFVDRFGLIGTMYAFTVNYVGYLLYTYLVARFYMRTM
ncbi:PST family polysaccharide transporter [Cupriavidus gilardii J11]|uniref:PST family polysaccharide transporter n=1 Tax=Cupriavidus gilardii J11 TaxID=936133 RepID=A0A562BMA8_9BURK|nr:O-antigen translocase [Cupriavidus gilardii]TWG86425.1 PST family polysaccharide transporter [Cupriavidus gilardii J11]